VEPPRAFHSSGRQVHAADPGGARSQADAAKRGYGERPVSLDEAIAFAPQRPAELLALDEAMEELAQVSAEKCRMVEMHFFGGMTHAEIAAVLKLHVNTVAKHLRVAPAWLQTRLT